MISGLILLNTKNVTIAVLDQLVGKLNTLSPVGKSLLVCLHIGGRQSSLKRNGRSLSLSDAYYRGLCNYLYRGP